MANTFQPSDLEPLSTWTVMQQAYLLSYKAMDQAVCRIGVSQAQASVLLALKSAGQPLPLSRLARALVQEAQSVTSLVDRLEARSLVRRVPDRRDRRVIHVEITADGEDMFEQVLPVALQSSREAFAGLDAGELRVLARLAAKVRARGADVLGLDPAPFLCAEEVARMLAPEIPESVGQ